MVALAHVPGLDDQPVHFADARLDLHQKLLNRLSSAFGFDHDAGIEN